MQKSDDKVINWIIGIGGNDMDNVVTYRIKGTKEQVKKHIVKAIIKDQANDSKNWNFGTICVNEISERENGKLYGVAVFDFYHYDYTATPEMEVVPA